MWESPTTSPSRHVGPSPFCARTTRHASYIRPDTRCSTVGSSPELLSLLHEEGVGLIAFSPLAQGLLTDRYLHGIPENSRAARPTGHLKREVVTPERVAQIARLNEIARQRGQSLAEMALAWLLRDNRVTSVLIGASSVEQLKDNLRAQENTVFSEEELQEIGTVLNQ